MPPPPPPPLCHSPPTCPPSLVKSRLCSRISPQRTRTARTAHRTAYFEPRRLFSSNVAL
ncbi:hypothetical protein DL89DRAFT_265885, partial [Linderina pennispora]